MNYAQATITAGEVVDQIKANVTVPWSEETVDTFKSGSADTEITGIATTFLATLDVLKEAHGKGLNMVVTHEPTYYNHFDETAQFGDDPVLAAKLKFIHDNNMVIWRFHDFWHQTEPDGIYYGILRELGWEEYLVESNVVHIPETSIEQLAEGLRDKFDIKTIRVMGDPDMKIRKIGLSLGAAGSMAHITLLKRNDIDLLICGEAREWETVEYVRDANSAGMNKGMILLGHAISEEPGMEYCAEWLKTFISEVPVEFIPAGEPFWQPED
jgi:putative NIF3 family GTP cyclohydrolase 1 type 2